ncbi:MAG: VWA domain-containing protein [Elusimicrobiaceae bacterium]|nr:VWA domain-containing protein [Elusimicrobiaceae bacterium]
MDIFIYPKTLILMLITLAFAGLIVYFGNVRKRKIILSLFTTTAWKRLVPIDAVKMCKFKTMLIMFSILFLFFALASPRWGVELEPSSSLMANTVIAVDVSSSMKATDVKPSRIESVKKILTLLADNLPNHRIAIVTFTSEAFVSCPLTLDTNAVKFFISRLQADSLPFYGTKISKAVLLSSDLMKNYPGEKGLIILTDGEDHKPEKINASLNFAKRNNIKIFTVGIGSKDGSLIPETIVNGKVKSYKKDADGNTVLSKLNEAFLVKLASETEGAYIRNDIAENTAEFLITELKNIDRALYETKTRAGYKNRYQIPLVISFIFLLLAIILPGTKINLKKINKKIFLFLFCLSLSATMYADKGDSDLIKGNKFYKNEQYGHAIDEYKQAYDKQEDKDKSLFNIGNALYKLKEYDKASTLYDEVIEKESYLAPKSYFNQGNANYYDGEKEDAILAYKEAILLNGIDERAIHNLQYILQEQQQEKDKQKDKNKEDQQNQDNQPNQDNKDSGGNGGADQSQMSQEDVDRVMQMAKQSETNASKKQQQQGSSAPSMVKEDKDW